MNHEFINKIKNLKANPAVTIYMNTNRTFPENNKDSINLKNQINEAEKRLINEYGEKESNPIVLKLKNMSLEIDHNFNLDSLIIFASSDFFEFVRLPVKVKDNVMIDNKFVTKVLLRTMLQTESYYVLCLSRKKIRLIEAVNDTVSTEIVNDDFPIINESYIDADDIKKAWSNVYDNRAKEFFNKADKKLLEYYNKNPKSVVLAGDVRNISYYKEIADYKNIFIGQVEGNYDNTKAQEVVNYAYAVVCKYIVDKQDKAIEDLSRTENEQKLLLDLNDIYLAAKEGRGSKLFVEKNYIQPAVIKNNEIILKDNPSGSDIRDDIVNDIIELIVNNGGDVLFCDVGKLKNYNKIVLVARY